jgi:hypothetical protein
VLQQQLPVAAACAAAAIGLPAVLTAARSASSSSSGSSKGSNHVTAEQGYFCSVTAGLAAALLQGAHLLLSQWVRSFAFLLCIVPAYALQAAFAAGTAAQLLRRAAALGGLAVLWWMHQHVPWLAELLGPHALLLAVSLR